MHFIVLFTDPKTEKRVLEITKCTVIAVRNSQSEYDSHHALAEVSILILLIRQVKSLKVSVHKNVKVDFIT